MSYFPAKCKSDSGHLLGLLCVSVSRKEIKCILECFYRTYLSVQIIKKLEFCVLRRKFENNKVEAPSQGDWRHFCDMIF